MRQDVGEDLNAFYDRASLSFFHRTTGSKTTFSGASTDVVAHEAGHAFLDAIRPQLFDVSLTETGAFHEAFGDIVAILVALLDQQIRETLLEVTSDLRQANFVEATAEDLSDGVRLAIGPNHPAAKPRRALNVFQWQNPLLLPTSAPPDDLSSEIHSFARVVSGCIYDTLSNIFNSRPARNQCALLEAAQVTGRLLIEAARAAPLETRFFRSIGRAMIHADTDQNGGANHLAIRDAFAAHNITLGSAAMLAPTSILAGAAPALTGKAKKLKVAKEMTPDLAKRMGLSGAARFTFRALRLAGETITEAVHDHATKLDKIHSRLKGVIAMAPTSVLIGSVGQRASILGGLPDLHGTEDEVTQFVATLLENDCIKFDKTQAFVSETTQRLRTHEIKKVGARKVLTRLAFDCFPNCAGRSTS
ncbi:MAG: hypothetical protein IH987_05130 [Planctomycetes bacterium]|nr:hypothetical protein [Planctomycetota bacterium]